MTREETQKVKLTCMTLAWVFLELLQPCVQAPRAPCARPVVGARVLQSEGRSRCRGEAWCPIRRAPGWQGWGPHWGLQVAYLHLLGPPPGGAASPEELTQGSSPFPGRLCQAPASTLLPGIWCREGCPACPGRSPRQSPFPRGRPLLPTDPPRPAVKPAPVFPIVG